MSSPSTQFEPSIEALRAAAGPYPLAAYEFVRAGLDYTVRRVHGQRDDNDRHVNGQQLSIGLRDYAIQQFGMMAPAVLANWNIRRTDDFGRIVFTLVATRFLRKTDQDSIEDFRAVYDFDEAFGADTLASSMGVRVDLPE